MYHIVGGPVPNYIAKTVLMFRIWFCGFGSVFRIQIQIQEGENGSLKGKIKTLVCFKSLRRIFLHFVFEIIAYQS
jgi:hypothetical protein